MSDHPKMTLVQRVEDFVPDDPSEYTSVYTETYVSGLRGKLELALAERDASRLYSQGFARRISEMGNERMVVDREVARLSGIIEEAHRHLSIYPEMGLNPSRQNLTQNLLEALAILAKAKEQS